MIIVKIGGDKSIRFDYIAQDIAWLVNEKKEKVLVLHGASKYRNELAEKLEFNIKKIISPSGVESYYSDERFMEVFLMAYAGLTNKKLVAELIRAGIDKPIGLTGVDAKLFLAKRKKFLYVKEGKKIKLIKGDLSGKVFQINIELIKLLLENAYLPVLTVPSIDEAGTILNSDNDAVLLELIKSFRPKIIFSLISEKGFLKDFRNKESLIKNLKVQEIDSFLTFAKGTMKKKLIYAKKYFAEGIEKMYIGDGRVKEPIIRLLTQSEGTVISKF